MANDDFSERYDLREFTPGAADDGTPTPETRAAMDAIGLGFHEPTGSPETVNRMVEHFVADGETWLGTYVRAPEAGSVDETWPVGTFAWFRKGLSWGDGALLDTQAISAVTVRPTERRRGILRAMMTRALERGVGAGYAVASLTASEGTIYRRFGFGSAIRERAITVRRARALPFIVPTSGIVSVVTPQHLADGVARQVFDRFHERTPGSMVRNSSTWDVATGIRTESGEPVKDVRAAVHRPAPGEDVDGYVTWRVTESRGSDTRIDVVDLVYATDAAYLSLWEFLLSIDLNDVVHYKRSRLDDPIVVALGDTRAYDVDHEEDHVWLRVLDVVATLSSRPYAVDGSLTLAVTDALGHASGTYSLDVLEGRGRVTRVDPASLAAGPDIALDVSDLGALLFGSVSPVTLAAAGLVRAADPAHAVLLRAMLLPPRTPHGITYF